MQPSHFNAFGKRKEGMSLVAEGDREAASLLIRDLLIGNGGMDRSGAGPDELVQAVASAYSVFQRRMEELHNAGATESKQTETGTYVMVHISAFANVLVKHGPESFLNAYEGYLVKDGDEPGRSITNESIRAMKTTLSIESNARHSRAHMHRRKPHLQTGQRDR